MRSFWIGSLALFTAAWALGCPFMTQGTGDTNSFGQGGAASASSGHATASSSGDGTGGTGGSTLCPPNSTKTCYPAPDGTIGMGECKAGTQTCRVDGTGYDACMGFVTP